MIDHDLTSQLDGLCQKHGSIVRLSDDAASTYLQELSNIYVADSSCLRWWESLKVDAAHFDYEAADGLAKLADLVERQAPRCWS